MKKFLIKGLVLIIILALPQQGVSMSYFSDTETVSGNTFTAGVWIPSKPGGLTIYRGHDPSTRVKIDCGALTNDTHITIEWDQNPESDIDYYWFGTKFNPKHKKVMFPNHEYRANMTPGHNPYYYTVIAVNTDGYESPISDQCGLILDQTIPQTTKGASNTSEGDPATSPPKISAIVINEILPNPSGDDNALKPAGEWVELYNRSGVGIDVDGWVLYDADNTHELPITISNTNTAGTIVPAHGFLVVYRNADADFSLDDDGDTVRLYDDTIGSGTLIDLYTYTGVVPDDKSIARYPDGSDTWYDPVPTPGGPNKLETEETEEVVGEDGESVGEDLGEPPVSEPSAELSDGDVSEEEARESVGEDVSGSQDSIEPPETDQDNQTQVNENSEQGVMIEESENEAQGASGDEPASDPEPETGEPQSNNPDQPSENNETSTE